MSPVAVRWSAAGLILALGVAAPFVGPRGLSQPREGAPWPGLGRLDAIGNLPPSADAATPDQSPIATLARALRIAIASQQAIEPASPAIGSDAVLVEDFGLESPPGSFLPLIRRGRRAPARHILTLNTRGEGTNEIRLHLLRGVSDTLAENHSIGWFRISGLPAGAARALVEFSISDGAILAGAADATNARALPFTRFEAVPEIR